MTPPLSAGSEIDAYCTWCKLDLGHRIVALVEGVPRRVVCLTCGREHNYHRPRVLAVAPVRRPGKPSRTSAAEPPRAAGAPRVTARAKAEGDRVEEWERRVAGQPLEAFLRYSVEAPLTEGTLVRHARFGDGYVVALSEGTKATVMFRDGPRTLACARSS